MNPEKDTISVIIHVYYPGSWQLIRQNCISLLKRANNIIITACHEDVIEELDMENAVILKSTNVGKDIGGKLISLEYYLSFCKPTEYIVFLHDKISPQSINADFWFNKLYEVFEENKFPKMIRLFDKKKKIGIAGSRYFLKNEYIRSEKKFDSTNSSILLQLIEKFKLKCKSYNYIGGTIFMAKSEIFSNFFSRHHSLEIREQLEAGNMLDLYSGTYTHSWERMFCFIAQAQGYKVVGV
jgi:lipopolysaccharide biosynthesis protein